MAYELLIQGADNSVRRFPLESESYSLGRAHGNDLCYPDDASLSRKHLVFERRADESWLVRDLGSKNGTLVNGTRVNGEQPLAPRDRVTAGQLTITYADPSQGPVDHRVVFVPEDGPELSPSATVMTSLEGLLSAEPTAPIIQPTAAVPTAAQQNRATFDSPVVRALITAGRELAQQRPIDELFELILDLSIRTVSAERGVLMTLEGDTLITRAVSGEGFRISTTVRDRVVKEKASLLVRDMQQEAALREQASIFAQQVQSLMAVPLQTENRVIGLVYLDSSLLGREFTPDDLNLLTVLANVAAIRIEQELYQDLRREEEKNNRDLAQAAEIQRGILPHEIPQAAGLDIAGYNVACRTVGGDYYDFFRYRDGRLGLVVADVAGKGMSAALLMSNLQARVQLLAEEPRDLAELMGRLDKSLSINCPANRFITMFMCVIDPATGEVVYCNAGHNLPLIVRSDGRTEALKAIGTVLGILPELGYEEKAARLEPGDVLAVYSDGVTESVAGEDEDDEYGEERLGQALIEHRNESAAAIVEAVNESLATFTDSAPPIDDVTLVVVRRTEKA